MTSHFSIQVRDSSDCTEKINFPNDNEDIDFVVIDSGSRHCNEPDIDNLADYNYVVPIFLSVYLLIGNVMLLNLLIAIFT